MKKSNSQKLDDTVPVDQQQTADQLDTVSRADFDKLRGEFDSLTDQLKRAVADYHNLEKRIIDGKNELSVWATKELIQDILPSLDHLDRALGGASEGERQSGWYKGVQLAVQQLRGILKDEGLEEIATDGQFDPTLHEAVDSRDGDEGQI